MFNIVLICVTGLFIPAYFALMLLPGMGYYGCKRYRYVRVCGDAC